MACITNSFQLPFSNTVLTASPVLEALNDSVTAQTNSSVTVSCEIYGYLPDGSEPQIFWRKLDGAAIYSDTPLYTISSSNGSKQIQNGGSTPSPSFISSLTIDVVDETLAGTYLCSSIATTVQAIMLEVRGRFVRLSLARNKIG